MTTLYETSRVRTMSLQWCDTCERWFHRPAHNCDQWQRPVNRKALRDGQAD